MSCSGSERPITGWISACRAASLSCASASLRPTTGTTPGMISRWSGWRPKAPDRPSRRRRRRWRPPASAGRCRSPRQCAARLLPASDEPACTTTGCPWGGRGHPRRKVMRHEPPQGTCLHDEAQPIEHLAQIVVALGRVFPQQREIGRRKRPLFIDTSDGHAICALPLESPRSAAWDHRSASFASRRASSAILMTFRNSGSSLVVFSRPSSV